MIVKCICIQAACGAAQLLYSATIWSKQNRYGLDLWQKVRRQNMFHTLKWTLNKFFFWRYLCLFTLLLVFPDQLWVSLFFLIASSFLWWLLNDASSIMGARRRTRRLFVVIYCKQSWLYYDTNSSHWIAMYQYSGEWITCSSTCTLVWQHIVITNAPRSTYIDLYNYTAQFLHAKRWPSVPISDPYNWTVTSVSILRTDVKSSACIKSLNCHSNTLTACPPSCCMSFEAVTSAE